MKLLMAGLWNLSSLRWNLLPKTQKNSLVTYNKVVREFYVIKNNQYKERLQEILQREDVATEIE